MNLDLGTMIENGEDVDILKGRIHLINHIHISEPGLKPVRKRDVHKHLAEILQAEDYEKAVSIEMGRQDDNGQILRTMEYVRRVFNEGV